MLNSPLAATLRMRVYRQRTRQRPPERGLRVVAMVGALLVHLIFLFVFVLGPAYPLQPPAPARRQVLQIRLIESSVPPPPPVRGSPPKERGPVHQGHRGVAVNTPVETPTVAVKPASPARTPASLPPVQLAPKPARALPPGAPKAAPVATPKVIAPPAKPLSPPIQPVKVARSPIPPRLQPEVVRKPQAEGSQPMPPPISLLMPKQASPSPPTELPRVAAVIEIPRNNAPLSVVAVPVTPPITRSVPLSRPASPSPSMNLRADLLTAEPLASPALSLSKPAAVPLATPLLTVAASPAEPAPAASPTAPAPAEPVEKIQMIAALPLPPAQPVVRPAVVRPSVSVPSTVVALAPAIDVPVPAQSSTSPAAPRTASAGAGPADVSRAPDATAQGSDAATPGQLNGVPAAFSATRSTVVVAPSSGQGAKPGQGGHAPSAGQTGAHQAGAQHGVRHGALGDYVQLKPQGDTRIMNHGAPNIGYRATRFEKDWTPENESSIDTVLRRAVEKTTVKHTFHLPRGIRVECAVMPLLPVSLLGCHNPDPPPRPVADKVYDRLHMAPANPVAAPAPAPNPATTTTSTSATIKFDNSAECAAARVAGGPAPPGCAPGELPLKPLREPASSSSSWAPASDQFH